MLPRSSWACPTTKRLMCGALAAFWQSWPQAVCCSRRELQGRRGKCTTALAALFVYVSLAFFFLQINPTYTRHADHQLLHWPYSPSDPNVRTSPLLRCWRDLKASLVRCLVGCCTVDGTRTSTSCVMDASLRKIRTRWVKACGPSPWLLCLYSFTPKV